MKPHRKGETTEAIVVAELMKRQIPVSIPFGDNERYDLVAETESGELVKLQIKTGRLQDGKVKFDGISQHTNATRTVYKRYEEDVDYFLVYCYELDSMYLVSESVVETKMALRVEEPTQQNSTINWADDYVFEDNWPPESGHEQTDDIVSEAIDALRASGSRVFQELDTDDPRSLVAEASGRYYRIRVEPGHPTEGRIRFRAAGDEDVDFYFAYCDDRNELYVVRNDAFDEAMSLRIEEPERNSQSINRAEDYEFWSVWPPASGILPSTTELPAVEASIDRLQEADTHVICADEDEDSRVFDVLVGDTRYRIRAESGYLDSGRLHFDAAGGSDVDYYFVYYWTDSELFVVPDDCFNKKMTLRVEEPQKADSSINWADDYAFADNWPPE